MKVGQDEGVAMVETSQENHRATTQVFGQAPRLGEVATLNQQRVRVPISQCGAQARAMARHDKQAHSSKRTPRTIDTSSASQLLTNDSQWHIEARHPATLR